MSDLRFSLRCRVRLLLIAIPLLFAVRGEAASVQLSSVEKQQLQRETRLVVDLLQNHHYSGRAFRDIDNKEMVGRFLEELDPGADFLTPGDVQFIHQRFDRTLKSVYLFRGDLQPAFEIFDLFADRARKRLQWVDVRLRSQFDFSREDFLEDSPRANSTGISRASDEDWEKRLQGGLLTEILLGRPEDEARQQLQERFAELQRQIAAVDSFAIREHFFDSVIRSFDPHSGYFSADSAKEFSVQMENAVVGLGLTVHKEKGRCVVSTVEPGGPADLHSNLAPGDVIVAFAEGEGPWVDASHQRMREIAALLQGKAGEKLRIAYCPEGTEERIEITLERIRLTLTSERAHGAISIVPDAAGRARQIGWISLPSFYASEDGAVATSATRDIGELLEQMAGQKIEGLVIDLRGNPGGAVTEALALTQLFLPRGTMMLSRGLGGKLTHHRLKDQPAKYGGPLVVLVSSQSASASEIFAGTIRYYQRGIVVGDAATFGKGTSQAYIPLARFPGIDANDTKEWGTLRVTTERFYMPDGRAIQSAGVASQIVFPLAPLLDVKREAELPHALPEESITVPSEAAADLPSPSWSPELLQHLREQADRNVRELPEWDLWRRALDDARHRLAPRPRSLNLATRRKEWSESLARDHALRSERRTLTATVRFPTEPLEIAVVGAALQSHEKKLRTLKAASGLALVNRFNRGAFLFETEGGGLREWRLAAIDVSAFAGDAAELATAFSDGAGRVIRKEEAGALLQTLALLPHKNDAAWIAAARPVLSGTWSDATIRRGLETLMLRLTQLEPALFQERPAFDVPLRESLRLSAEWASRTSGGEPITQAPTSALR